MKELSNALAIVGHKWTLMIIGELLAGPKRFTQIERSLVLANPKMVTARLRELESAGLVSRTTYAEVPPRVEYALTERGHELRPAINALRRWAAPALLQRDGFARRREVAGQRQARRRTRGARRR